MKVAFMSRLALAQMLALRENWNSSHGDSRITRTVAPIEIACIVHVWRRQMQIRSICSDFSFL